MLPRVLALGLVGLTLAACEKPSEPSSAAASAPAAAENPFLAPSPLPHGLPPFDRIEHEHFKPAFEEGMAEEQAQVAAIVANPAPPTFENTIVALEKTGAVLDRVSRVFYALSSAHTNEAIRALRAELAPKLSAHRDGIMLNPELFARVSTVFEARDEAGLRGEDLRLVEETYRDFQRAGAALDAPAR